MDNQVNSKNIQGQAKDALGIQQVYTDYDWAMREAYYTSALAKLQVPTTFELGNISEFNSNLDKIKTEATMEIAFIERQYEKFNNLLKNSEKEIFIILKKQELTKDPKTKFATVADIEGLTVAYLKKNPIGNLKTPIYEVKDKIFSRLAFMKRVVEILKDKQQALITVNLLFKTENDNTKVMTPGAN